MRRVSGDSRSHPVVATRSARRWSPGLPSGITPLPLSAWESRTLSRALWQRRAWWSGRSDRK